MFIPRIKICGLTRACDVDAAVSAGADALGFVFYGKSPRYVEPPQAAKLVAGMPPFVTSVGLFVDAAADEVVHALKTGRLDLLQFHGDESPGYCEQFDRPYIKAVRVKPGLNLLEYAERYASARGLLLDAYVEGVPGGTGATFDWTLIPPQLPLPVILSGGLDAANVESAARAVRPWAVDVSSGVESSKGIKDASKIAAFINGVRNANV
ncbi:phosphoribosylanthranilate isomerase [Chitinivorax sp. PXF-14]|uniref:phosphoribosylanthranilate isomerase n=1 Tax=Chitinivorax sp. PXF-14 TaxID=3230488 RepID=UPI003466C5D6